MRLVSSTAQGKLRPVFIGTAGLRPGWGVLIFISMFMALALAARAAMHGHMGFPKGEIAPRVELLLEGIQVAAVLALTAIMGWIEGKPFWAYGLAGPRAAAHFFWGLPGGALCLSALVGVLAAGGYIAFGGLALHGLPRILGYGLVWLAGFTLTGVTEEALFRGYLQTTLARGIGFWPAAVLLSLLFAVSHLQNGGETLAGVTQVLVAGLVLCFLLWVSGSLWLSIGFHAAWDWAQSYLYGTPDSGMMMQGHMLITHAIGDVRLSGGAVGPEGSWLASPIMVAGAVVLVWAMRRAGFFSDAAPAIAAPPAGDGAVLC